MQEPKIHISKDAEDIGLATMLADLMRQNMEKNPYKKRHFRMLDALVYLEATDIDVQLTLDFRKGKCTIYQGEVGRPHLDIRTDSDSILSLSLVSVRFGLPDFFNKTGGELLKNIAVGKVKIRGLLRHFLALQLVTVVLSVN
jgi:hypothetical protein